MLNAGSTAWVLVSAALVMLMTPGLAFFYGGMVRSKSVLNMLMMNFMCLAIVSVLWCLYGFSLAFGNDLGGGLLGGFEYVGLGGLPTDPIGTDPDKIPILAFAMFQLMFAIITPALISGAVPERTKFWSWGIFVVLWSTIVYFPVAHWVFAFDGTTAETGGWIANTLGALDFAGGTAVHINAGAAGLALAIVLGKRRGWPRDPGRPHSLPFVLLGASLLWFGWYGFNAGSALGANQNAAIAFTTTTLATAAAVIGWLVVEQLRDGKPTTLGAASGAVAGLVAITPACAFVNPIGGLAIGVIAGAVCALCVSLKFRLGFDDSLDVVAVHLVGGLIGTILIGFFGTTSLNEASADGLFYGGGFGQLGIQVVAALAVLVYSFVVTAIIALVIKVTIGFRVSDEDESTGIDESQHAESSYDYSGLRSSGGHSSILDAATSKVPASAGQEG
ncbi:ammonium transporter [Actinomycetospora termitidis]|uniref:Ammonium transporter n=1 Tax=Actinomycetospora termitidis TaxID=3053470 RepID=A0ABT7M5L6_9PSEU|nr:ammonium transporter [Actinomycetospora sp. Odt1-22]MDL5155962.1 ammonium transporter [Actinomycetospora sp. Odt1-22]